MLEIEIEMLILNRGFLDLAEIEIEIAFYFSRFSILNRDRDRNIEDRDSSIFSPSPVNALP